MLDADSPGSYLVNYLTNYLAVLWLGTHCSGSCWFQTWGVMCNYVDDSLTHTFSLRNTTELASGSGY